MYVLRFRNSGYNCEVRFAIRRDAVNRAKKEIKNGVSSVRLFKGTTCVRIYAAKAA